MNNYFTKEQLETICQLDLDTTFLFYEHGKSGKDFLDEMIKRYPNHKEDFLEYKILRNGMPYYDELREEFVKCFTNKLDIYKDIDLWFPEIFNTNQLMYQKISKAHLSLFDSKDKELIKTITKKTGHFGFYYSYLKINNDILDVDIISDLVNNANTSYDNATSKIFNLLIKLPQNEQTFNDLLTLKYKTQESTHQILCYLNSFNQELKNKSNIKELNNYEIEMKDELSYSYTVKMNTRQIAVQINSSKSITEKSLTNFINHFGNYLQSKYRIDLSSAGFDGDEIRFTARTSKIENIDIVKKYCNYIKENQEHFIKALRNSQNENGFSYFIMHSTIDKEKQQPKKQKL